MVNNLQAAVKKNTICHNQNSKCLRVPECPLMAVTTGAEYQDRSCMRFFLNICLFTP